jgi:hypothetical protein
MDAIKIVEDGSYINIDILGNTLMDGIEKLDITDSAELGWSEEFKSGVAEGMMGIVAFLAQEQENAQFDSIVSTIDM